MNTNLFRLNRIFITSFIFCFTLIVHVYGYGGISMNTIVKQGETVALTVLDPPPHVHIRLDFTGTGVEIVNMDVSRHNFAIKFKTPGIINLNIKLYQYELKGTQSWMYVTEYNKTISVVPNQITGDNSLCGTGIYKLDNLPSNLKPTWSVSNGLEIISGQGTSQIQVKSVYYQGNASISANVGGFNLSKSVIMNVPDPDYLKPTLPKKLYTEYDYYNESSVSWGGGASSEILEYKWEIYGWEVINMATGSSAPYSRLKFKAVNPGSSANIKLSARNRCGWGGVRLLWLEVGRSPMYDSYKISSDGYGLVTIQEDQTIEKELTNNVSTMNYELYNQANGNLIDKGKMDKSGGTVDFSRFPKGIYIFNLNIDAENRQTHRLIIK